jgi:hypothetical protein
LLLSLTACPPPYFVTSGDDTDTLRVVFERGDDERVSTVSHDVTGDAVMDEVVTEISARSDSDASMVELTVFDSHGELVGSSPVREQVSTPISITTNEGAPAPFDVDFSVHLFRDPLFRDPETVWVYSDVTIGWSDPREDAAVTTLILEDE